MTVKLREGSLTALPVLLTSEGGHGHEHRDDDGEPAVQDLGEGDGHGLGAEDLGHAEGGVEGDVGEGVHDRHQDDGDADGPGQVPHRVLQLLDHEVEVVPAEANPKVRNHGEGPY